MKDSQLPARRLVLAMALSGLGLAACDKLGLGGQKSASKSNFHAVDITGAEYANAFTLPDFDGHTRSLADFKGKVVFVFFGYTQCPDVCPTTMAELAEVRRRLGPEGDKVQGVFVTVDPERDTPEILKAYLQGMDKTFVGLRGTADQTEAVTRAFKVFYQKVPTKDGYTMDHTAGAYVFDPEGRIRLFVRYGMPVADLTSDLRQLLTPPAA
jgi:protein SCO1/2